MNKIKMNTTALEDVRALCIRKNWYTRGCNREYSNLFEMIGNGAAIMDIADDIYQHSTLESCPSVGTAYQELSKLADIWRLQLNSEE